MPEQSVSSLPEVRIADTAGGLSVGVHNANTVTDNMDDEFKLFEEAACENAGLGKSKFDFSNLLKVLLMQG